MKNPYKIIHKFKNNNGRTQYFVYIFVGPLVDDDIMKILKSIKTKIFIIHNNNFKNNFKVLVDIMRKMV